MAEMSQEPEGSSSQANPKDTKVVYEVGFHLVPTLAESEVGGAVEKIRAALQASGAEIIKEEFPAKRTLAYVVERAAAGKREKYAESYFGWIKFAVEERGAVPAIEAALRAMQEVLRSLIVETVREEVVIPRRAVFRSDRLEGETIKKPLVAAEPHTAVSEEELDKSIDALVN